MNDTLGPEGLVPSALVFGEFPPVYTRSETPALRATILERAEIAHTARREMEKHMARLRINRALQRRTPAAADRSYKPGDHVLVWREKLVESRIGEWIGPFEVIGADESKKLVYVQDSKIGAARPFNIAQVKRYLPPETLANHVIDEIADRLTYFASPPDDEVHLTEIISSGDPRASSSEMSEAKKREIRGLLDRGTFKVILKKDLPRDANVLPGRFVLTIKSTEDGQVKHKARYVIGGHRGKLKKFMVHDTATLQPQSVRLLLALASIFGFDVWTSDVTQAYLQSSEPLARKIFIREPVPEFELDPKECLELLKPLYGLCESGDLWHATLDKHHRHDLNMQPLRSDPALYAWMTHGLLRGLSGGYVDDLIRAGDSQFKIQCAKTHTLFEMSKDRSVPYTFTGFSLNKNNEGEFVQSQREYLKKLECLPTNAPFSDFRSMRMRLAWLSNTRPDCLFEVSQLAQVTEARFKASPKAWIRRLNKAVKLALINPISLRVAKLDPNTIRVIGYSDASFANNEDLSSQLGYICFIGDDTGAVVPFHFKSYKARRVTRSVMAAEVIAFSDLFDVATTLSQELEKLLRKRVPVQLLTDSKSLFDIISKGTRTSEKRMMLDIAAARERFRTHLISDIGFVRSSKNIADGLTKPMRQQALQQVVSCGQLLVEPEQWIIRGRPSGAHDGGEC